MDSKAIKIAAVASALGIAAPLAAQVGTTLQPATIGAQWDAKVASSCAASNDGGWSCLRFQNTTYIYNITWESSVKNSTDALWTLVMTNPADPLPPTGQINLFSTFQLGQGVTIKEPAFANRPVRIPAGWIVWIAMQSDFPTTVSAEIQTTIWTDPVSGIEHWCPNLSVWKANFDGC